MTTTALSDLEIRPGTRLAGTISIPASKSSSTRSLLAAALAPGRSHIRNVANSNNVHAMLEAVRTLGATVVAAADGVTVDGVGRQGLRDGIVLDPGNSGIVLRLLLGATAVLRDVRFETQFAQSLGRRANAEMLHALRRLGVDCEPRTEDGQLPIRLRGANVHGGTTAISSSRSSQFLSGLLYLGGLLDEPLTVTVPDDITAKAMVGTTIAVLRQAGIDVEVDASWRTFRTSGRQHFRPASYRVGSDPASTAALLAVTGIVESDVTLAGFHEEELGDGAVLDYVRRLGISAEFGPAGLRVRGGGSFKAQDFDGSKAPDAVLPLAALAAYADGTSRFYNIEHIRYKECDRISDFRRELLAAGVRADERRDELIVHGSPGGIAGGAVVDGHFDHGVIMALSALALRSDAGLVVRDPRHVGQTYPAFFDDLRSIGGDVRAAGAEHAQSLFQTAHDRV